MQWIAPSEKDTHTDGLEKNLWASADQFRANSGLKAQEYSGPILGLIFLRFVEMRFAAQLAKLEKAGASSRRASRIDDATAYHADGVLYLAPEARFEYLLTLPEAADIGAKINAAMRDIEKHNTQLAGVLPKTYNLFAGTLLKELLKKVSEIPASTDYDAFGRIYEYFLGEFARTEGQKGGEFYTPASIVRLLTEVIEPFHGRILDPACGSGGMFVQSARFVAEHQKNPAAELAICGVEKTDETGRLCRLNLSVHGLEGDIRHGGNVNSYYDDPHTANGKFDFVLANPPFNVNAVDKERLKDMVGAGRRFPFGLPKSDNANYLWIQLFHSALNAAGRAGFVMANSASDARSSEQEIRQRLIEDKSVDVMVAVGPNMFYTVTLPCTLWFLDRGKAKTKRADTVLFIDARHIYRQVDRAHRDWTSAQIGFLANLVRLHRGEDQDLTYGGEDAGAKLKEIFGKKPAYIDVPGLCKAATLAEIEAQGWSLNPGRYVGVAPGEEVSDEDFKAQLETLNEELETMNAQSRELEETIAANVAEILGGVMGATAYQPMPLGDVVRLGSGKSIKPGGEGGYPVYGSNGIIGGSDEYRYENGIVIGRVGAYCGSVAYCSGRFWASDNTLVAFPASAAFDTKFLFYLLTDAKLRRHAGGAAQPLVTQTVLKQVEVGIPPLAVQHRIAGILSAYDELIENSQRRILILETMARALYCEWFVHFRFPGHENHPRVSSPLGEIPEGWVVGRLDDVIVLQRGFDLPKTKRVEGDTPIYAAAGVTGHHSAAKVRAPSVVTGRSGTIGEVFYIQEDFWPLNTVLWAKSFPRSEPLYAYYLLSSLDLKQFNSGSAVPTLNRNDIHGLDVLIPPRFLQKRFQEHAGAMLRQVRIRKLQVENLRRTRDLLLPRLLSGQIDANVD